MQHSFLGHSHTPNSICRDFERAHAVVAKVDLVEGVTGGVRLHVLLVTCITRLH